MITYYYVKYKHTPITDFFWGEYDPKTGMDRHNIACNILEVFPEIEKVRWETPEELVKDLNWQTRWESYEPTVQARIISNEELADLPSFWENSKVNHAQYSDAVLTAWEVNARTYNTGKARGALCLRLENHFYLANMDWVFEEIKI